MSDTLNADGNGQEPQEQGNQMAGPGMNILAQYLKDLSFENPKAPGSLQNRDQAPALNINVNVNAKPVSDNEFEVILMMESRAGTDDDVLFNVEIAYGGLFRIFNVPKEHIHPFVMIECPRLLFPFARQIVAEATRNGGFPPLMIDPIDFAALYRQNLAQQQGQAGAPAPQGGAVN